MKDYENMQKAAAAFREMSEKYRHATLVLLLTEGTVDMTAAISAYGKYLEDYKRGAEHDIYKLSEIGLRLGEKTFKSLRKVKNPQVADRAVVIAWLRALVSGGGFHETKFLEELLRGIDLKEIDEWWYGQSWKLKQPRVPDAALDGEKE